jgi:hypothetical protein
MKNRNVSALAVAVGFLLATAAFAGPGLQLDEKLYMGGFDYLEFEEAKAGAPAVDERLFIGGFDAPADWRGGVAAVTPMHKVVSVLDSRR